MNEKDSDPRLGQDPEGQLEQALIDEFLRSRGHDSQSICQLPEDKRMQLLQAASTYAATKLTEVEARARYVHNLHGD